MTPKKRAAEDETATTNTWSLPSGVKEEDLHPIRYETYSQDYDWVHHAQASLLRLPPGIEPTEADFNSSARYVPQSMASEKEVPKIVTSHWLPILEEQGHLADCPPSEFIATDDWVPLYTPDRLEKHLPAALVAYGLPSKQPRLMAVVPAVSTASMLGPDKEFLLTNFHHRDCLTRQSLTILGKQKQVAFFLYC